MEEKNEKNSSGERTGSEEAGGVAGPSSERTRPTSERTRPSRRQIAVVRPTVVSDRPGPSRSFNPAPGTPSQAFQLVDIPGAVLGPSTSNPSPPPGDDSSSDGIPEYSILYLGDSSFQLPSQVILDLRRKMRAMAYPGYPTFDVDQSSDSLLSQAARDGLTGLVDTLLTVGADPNFRERGGHTPLHQAARNGHTDIVRLLLLNGAEASNRTTAEGWTALHLAAEGGHYNTVRALLSAGADVNAVTDFGYLAFDFASINSHRRVLSLLERHMNHVPPPPGSGPP